MTSWGSGCDPNKCESGVSDVAIFELLSDYLIQFQKCIGAIFALLHIVDNKEPRGTNKRIVMACVNVFSNVHYC